VAEPNPVTAGDPCRRATAQRVGSAARRKPIGLGMPADGGTPEMKLFEVIEPTGSNAGTLR